MPGRPYSELVASAAEAIPPVLPGSELIITGLDDLRASRQTVESLLVSQGAPRMRAVGLDVPEQDRLDAGTRMYELLGASDPDNAYGAYNALRRRLVSFLVALEQDARRARGLPLQHRYCGSAALGNSGTSQREFDTCAYDGALGWGAPFRLLPESPQSNVVRESGLKTPPCAAPPS